METGVTATSADMFGLVVMITWTFIVMKMFLDGAGRIWAHPNRWRNCILTTGAMVVAFALWALMGYLLGQLLPAV